MIEPGSGNGPKANNMGEVLRMRYQEQKTEFLDLCWRHGLGPRDLSLSGIEKSKIEQGEKLRILRLIVSLSGIERDLGPKAIDNRLFAQDETNFGESVIFQTAVH